MKHQVLTWWREVISSEAEWKEGTNSDEKWYSPRNYGPEGRGFESLTSCHERNLFCLPRQERLFHAFRGRIALKIGKCRQNRGWNGHWGRASLSLRSLGKLSVLLFVFLYRAKKLAKQLSMGFEYKIDQRRRVKWKEVFLNDRIFPAIFGDRLLLAHGAGKLAEI